MRTLDILSYLLLRKAFGFITNTISVLARRKQKLGEFSLLACGSMSRKSYSSIQTQAKWTPKQLTRDL